MNILQKSTPSTTFTFPPFSFLIKPKQEKREGEGEEKKDHVSQKKEKTKFSDVFVRKENTSAEKKLPRNEVEIFEYTVVNWICIH